MREEHAGVRCDEEHGDGDFDGGEVNSDERFLGLGDQTAGLTSRL